MTLARLLDLDQVNDYIFPGRSRDSHMNRTTARLLWKDVCATAQVDGVTLHDCRRSVGLWVAREAGIAVAAKVLRHSRVDVTARTYAPFNVGELRKATENALVKQGKLLHLRPKGKVREAKRKAG
jgi:integrase